MPLFAVFANLPRRLLIRNVAALFSLLRLFLLDASSLNPVFFWRKPLLLCGLPVSLPGISLHGQLPLCTSRLLQ